MSKTTNVMIRDYEMPGDIRAWGVYVADAAGNAVKDLLKSRWLNTGKQERLFREKFRQRFGAPYAVATVSGTASLRATLAMLGVGPGDEVVTTPITFIATNTSILEQGATPVFADVQYNDFNIDPDSIEEHITPRTKAIICVHFAGNACDMDRIWDIGRRHGLPVIEDSAHALGSRYKGKYIGSQGDLACFSFQAVKIVTTGDGGMITTTREDYYKQLKRYVWYGVDREERGTKLLDPLPEDIDILGFKYNMNDITATLGVVAMDHFDVPIKRRREIGQRYRAELGGLRRLKLIELAPYQTPNYQIFPVHVEDRMVFAEHMVARGIQVLVNNRRNDRYSLFGGARDLPNVKRADEDMVLLPIHFDVTDADVERVVEAVKDYDRR